MKLKFILITALFFSFALAASPTKKADELCGCMKKAQASQKQKDKSKCLSMREKHVKALKKNSQDHETYLTSLQKCERELGGLPDVKSDATLDEKIKIVCDCFETTEKPDRFKCFKLQSDYEKTISDSTEKQKFNLTSGSCDK